MFLNADRAVALLGTEQDGILKPSACAVEDFRSLFDGVGGALPTVLAPAAAPFAVAADDLVEASHADLACPLGQAHSR